MAKKSTIGKQSSEGAVRAGSAGGLSRNALLLIVTGVALAVVLIIILQQTLLRGSNAAVSGGLPL